MIHFSIFLQLYFTWFNYWLINNLHFSQQEVHQWGPADAQCWRTQASSGKAGLASSKAEDCNHTQYQWLTKRTKGENQDSFFRFPSLGKSSNDLKLTLGSPSCIVLPTFFFSLSLYVCFNTTEIRQTFSVSVLNLCWLSALICHLFYLLFCSNLFNYFYGINSSLTSFTIYFKCM